jgi:hypothetical protein
MTNWSKPGHACPAFHQNATDLLSASPWRLFWSQTCWRSTSERGRSFSLLGQLDRILDECRKELLLLFLSVLLHVKAKMSNDFCKKQEGKASKDDPSAQSPWDSKDFEHWPWWRQRASP